MRNRTYVYEPLVAFLPWALHHNHRPHLDPILSVTLPMVKKPVSHSRAVFREISPNVNDVISSPFTYQVTSPAKHYLFLQEMFPARNFNRFFEEDWIIFLPLVSSAKGKRPHLRD